MSTFLGLFRLIKIEYPSALVIGPQYQRVRRTRHQKKGLSRMGQPPQLGILLL
jgi:hypothetical protein